MLIGERNEISKYALANERIWLADLIMKHAHRAIF